VPKILGQSGASISDIYDVEGSIVGVDELDSGSVQTVHEMGDLIFSERCRGTIRIIESGDILQSVNIDVVSVIPDITPASRLIGVTVVVNQTSRISHLTVSLRNVGNSREVPLFLWDTSNDREISWRGSIGGSIANNILLQPIVNTPHLPTMLIRAVHGDSGLTTIALRGRTTAFGAGTVEATALFTTFSPNEDMAVPSNEGLPIPSW